MTADDDTLRIGQAAALLGVSVDTIRRWGDEGRIAVVRSSGGQRLVALSEVRRLLGQRPRTQHRMAASSARNQLDAVVTNVVQGTAAASVEMQAGPYRLVALTTAESVDELDLSPGTRVIASVKATSVIVGLPEGEGERQRAGGRGLPQGEGERQRAGGRGLPQGEGERQRAGGRGSHKE